MFLCAVHWLCFYVQFTDCFFTCRADLLAAKSEAKSYKDEAEAKAKQVMDVCMFVCVYALPRATRTRPQPRQSR
jgi:hypothetical protein